MSDMKAPDCMTCWRKNICPQAEEGKFCTSWQTKEPVTSSVSASADTIRGCRPAYAENSPPDCFPGAPAPCQGKAWRDSFFGNRADTIKWPPHHW